MKNKNNGAPKVLIMEEPPVQAQVPSQEEDQVAKDEVQGISSPISLPQGPITRSRAKKLQQTLNSHLQGDTNPRYIKPRTQQS